MDILFFEEDKSDIQMDKILELVPEILEEFETHISILEYLSNREDISKDALNIAYIVTGLENLNNKRDIEHELQVATEGFFDVIKKAFTYIWKLIKKYIFRIDETSRNVELPSQKINSTKQEIEKTKENIDKIKKIKIESVPDGQKEKVKKIQEKISNGNITIDDFDKLFKESSDLIINSIKDSDKYILKPDTNIINKINELLDMYVKEINAVSESIIDDNNFDNNKYDQNTNSDLSKSIVLINDIQYDDKNKINIKDAISLINIDEYHNFVQNDLRQVLSKSKNLISDSDKYINKIKNIKNKNVINSIIPILEGINTICKSMFNIIKKYMSNFFKLTHMVDDINVSVKNKFNEQVKNITGVNSKEINDIL